MSGGTGAPGPPLPPTSRERQLSGHIFTVSAGLVGVCLTVIGFFRLFTKPDEVRSIADNLIAIDAIFFLFACILAYLALRSVEEHRWRQLERYADALFLLAISGMVLISGLVAYELI